MKFYKSVTALKCLTFIEFLWCNVLYVMKLCGTVLRHFGIRFFLFMKHFRHSKSVLCHQLTWTPMKKTKGTHFNLVKWGYKPWKTCISSLSPILTSKELTFHAGQSLSLTSPSSQLHHKGFQRWRFLHCFDHCCCYYRTRLTLYLTSSTYPSIWIKSKYLLCFSAKIYDTDNDQNNYEDQYELSYTGNGSLFFGRRVIRESSSFSTPGHRRLYPSQEICRFYKLSRDVGFNDRITSRSLPEELKKPCWYFWPCDVV